MTMYRALATAGARRAKKGVVLSMVIYIYKEVCFFLLTAIPAYTESCLHQPAQLMLVLVRCIFCASYTTHIDAQTPQLCFTKT